MVYQALNTSCKIQILLLSSVDSVVLSLTWQNSYTRMLSSVDNTILCFGIMKIKGGVSQLICAGLLHIRKGKIKKVTHSSEMLIVSYLLKLHFELHHIVAFQDPPMTVRANNDNRISNIDMPLKFPTLSVIF